MKSTEYKYNQNWLQPRPKNLYQFIIEQEPILDKILTNSCLQSPSKILKDDSFLHLLENIDKQEEISISIHNNPQTLFQTFQSSILINQSLDQLINYEHYKILKELQKYLIIQSILPIYHYRYLNDSFGFIIRIKSDQIITLILKENIILKFIMQVNYNYILCKSTNQQMILKPNLLHTIKKQVSIHNQGNVCIPICFYLLKNK